MTIEQLPMIGFWLQTLARSSGVTNADLQTIGIWLQAFAAIALVAAAVKGLNAWKNEVSATLKLDTLKSISIDAYGVKEAVARSRRLLHAECGDFDSFCALADLGNADTRNHMIDACEMLDGDVRMLSHELIVTHGVFGKEHELVSAIAALRDEAQLVLEDYRCLQSFTKKCTDPRFVISPRVIERVKRSYNGIPKGAKHAQRDTLDGPFMRLTEVLRTTFESIQR